MEEFWLQALIPFTLAPISSFIFFGLAISAALIDPIVGIVAGNTIHSDVTPWVNFLASFGAVIFNFLAGAELESEVIKAYWKEFLVLVFISFFCSLFTGVGLLLSSYLVVGT
ncbi:MAG: sodium:proton antiporter [Thermodesulfobacteriaceae bacterium]|jgi:Kef-type K+ transport system membrane component KefB